MTPLISGVALCALLAGCAQSSPGRGGSGGASETAPTSTAPTSIASVTPSATSPRPEQTIQQVDLGSLKYTVSSDRRSVTLVKGTNTDEYGRVTKLGQTLYSDADGDGFPDAAIEITIADGNGFEALWYIVRWDPASQQPVVFDDPFARTFRCGDVVDSVTAASRGFTVTEHRTEGTPTNCSAQPPVAITRTVGIRDGWLAELSPNQGYGGICPHSIGDDGTHAPPDELRIGPNKQAPSIGDTAKGAWLLSQPENSTYAGKTQWRLLGYSTKDTAETWYSACAWAEA